MLDVQRKVGSNMGTMVKENCRPRCRGACLRIGTPPSDYPLLEFAAWIKIS